MIAVIFVALVLFGSRLNVPPWAITGLLLLVCPLSMAFMHGEHDYSDNSNSAKKNEKHSQHKH
jgi:hypothetical protein